MGEDELTGAGNRCAAAGGRRESEPGHRRAFVYLGRYRQNAPQNGLCRSWVRAIEPMRSPLRFSGGSFSCKTHSRQRERKMGISTQERNKTLVLEAFDTLFNRRDYAGAEKYWSPDYIQHSAHIAPGREGFVRVDQKHARDFAVRTRPDSGGGAVGYGSWPFQQFRSDRELDRRG